MSHVFDVIFDVTCCRYVVGGRDGLKTLNTVECYDPKKKTWTLMPPMATHRHGLGELGGVGGAIGWRLGGGGAAG